MAIDVVMPQMGESIAEGTVVRWMKKPGDKVERAATPPPAPVQKAEPAAPAQTSEQRAGSSERVGAPPPRATEREPRTADVTSLDERRRTKSSPLVRKIAQENNVDITQIQGSG